MKPAAFDYEKPADLAAAVKALSAADGTAQVMAGGQSLGPLLNLRLVQPALVVDVRGIDELSAVRLDADALVVGACITHAAIEDGALADVTRGLMPAVAADIAYRAVRNRGTIGGSLCLADPAADWVSALMLLDACAILHGPRGRREVPVARFVVGAYTTVRAEDEILVAVRIPKLSARARWGYYKFCRKPGEFAEALAAVVVDPARRVCRAVIGATYSAPHLVEDAQAFVAQWDERAAMRAVEAARLGDDPYQRRIHHVALRRAVQRLAQST